MSDVSDQWWASYASAVAVPRNESVRVAAEATERDARALRNTAKCAKKIERELAWLGDEWHVLHVVEKEVDIDYILVGPAGVITLTTKRIRNAKVSVTDSRVLVDGQPRNYVRNSCREAQRVERMLSVACGESVQVRAAVVLVDVHSLIIGHMSDDVQVTTRRPLLPWLKSLPETTDASAVELIHNACLSGSGSISRRVVAS